MTKVGTYRFPCIALGLLAGMAQVAQAQIGTGWTATALSKTQDVDGCGSISGDTFKLTCSTTGSAWQRAEYKLGTSTSGYRQFQGDIKVVTLGGTGICLKQTFNSTEPFFMLSIKSGGALYDHGNSGAGTFMTGVVGKTVRVNTIVGGGTHKLYLNGSLKETRTTTGSFFDKYGVYKTASGQGPITATWTGIKSWKK